MSFMIIGIPPPLYWVEPSGRACVRYHTFLLDDLYFQTNIFCVKDGKLHGVLDASRHFGDTRLSKDRNIWEKIEYYYVKYTFHPPCQGQK